MKMIYRELAVGETVQPGDEFKPSICEWTKHLYPKEGWYPAPGCFVGQVLTESHVEYRRREADQP